MALNRWGIPSFTVDTDTDLLTVPSGQECAIWSILIASSAAETANFIFKHTDTDGTTVIFQWPLAKSAGESPTAIQAPVAMKAGDKIIVQCDKAEGSVLASAEVK